VRRALTRHRIGALLVGFLVMAGLRFLLPALFNPGGLGQIKDMSVWMYQPTAHAGTYLLGALLESTPRRSWERGATICMGIVYALAVGLYFPGNNSVLMVAAILLVGVVPAIPAPRIAAQVSILVSQASFYIYLLHMLVWSLLLRMGIGEPKVSLVLGLPFMIVAAAVCDRAYSEAASCIARRGRGGLLAAGREALGPSSSGPSTAVAAEEGDWDAAKTRVGNHRQAA
jgi:hypothetical protein